MISVIVPVYNVEKYLRRCIDGILAQTYKDFELIIVDDGSTDNCPQICDEYSLMDSRVRIIHQKNQGQAAARNIAIDEAKGEWICFVDGDDFIHCQTLEILYEIAQKNGASISMCSAIESVEVPDWFSETRDFSYSLFEIDENKLKDLYANGEHRIWVVWGKLIKKSIVEKYPFTFGRIYEDNAVVCKWLCEASKVADTSEKLYFYTVNCDGTTKSKFTPKKLDYLWAMEEIIKFYHSKKYSDLWQEFCLKYMNVSIEYRYRVLDELNDFLLAERISKNMRKVYCKNHCGRFLKCEDKKRIFYVIYPKRMWVYELILAFKKTLKEHSIGDVFKKILRYIRRKSK